MLPAKLAIIYRNIFTFFHMLKETSKFWASGCHVTRYCYGELRAPGQNWGGPWHGRSQFSYLGWQDFYGPRLIWPGFSDFWYFLQNKTKRHHCRKVLKQKNIEKTLLQEYKFFRIFLLNRFFSCKHLKKPGHIRPGLWKIGLKINFEA